MQKSGCRRRVVGLIGYARSGKSTASAGIRAAIGDGSVAYSMAKPLKDGLAAWFGFSHDQLYGEGKEQVDPRYNCTPRSLMLDLGTGVMRDRLHMLTHVKLKRGAHLWVSRFHDFMNEIKTDTVVVVDDVRFQDEVDAITQYEHQMLFIDREAARPSKQQQRHISEQPEELVKYYEQSTWCTVPVIKNEGTKEELAEACLKFLDEKK